MAGSISACAGTQQHRDEPGAGILCRRASKSCAQLRTPGAAVQSRFKRSKKVVEWDRCRSAKVRPLIATVLLAAQLFGDFQLLFRLVVLAAVSYTHLRAHETDSYL